MDESLDQSESSQRFQCSQRLQAELCTLRLSSPFRIAHGASSERQVLRVRAGGGHGEAPFVPYYPEDPAVALSWLRRLEDFEAWRAEGRQGLGQAPRSVRLALDVLQHDLMGKASGRPVWRMLELLDPNGVPSSRSLSIPTDLSEFSERVRVLAGQFGMLKLKLGSGNLDFDEAIVATAREAAPHIVLFGDVNGGWTPREAIQMIPRLVGFGMAFLEQPVHHDGGREGWLELCAGLGSERLPLFADESVQNAADVSGLADLVQGINVKLLKCGGFGGALEMIQAARKFRLQILLGCMVESSLGVTAAAHLAAAVDWVDLDGHFYLAEDDFAGLNFDAQGRLILPFTAGIGVKGAMRTALD
jgi:L-Ala-D/L-Glu epimerase